MPMRHAIASKADDGGRVGPRGAQMKHATTRALFSYWDSLRGERAAPERGEIEPGAIRHILADTFILEAAPDATARFRLAGTRLCMLLGAELRGRDFGSLWISARGRAEIGRMAAAVLDEAAGVVGSANGLTERGERADLEFLLLPLRHRGRTHARLLGAMSAAALPPWLGFDRIAHVETTSLRIIRPAGRERAQAPQTASAGRRRHLLVYPGGRA